LYFFSILPLIMHIDYIMFQKKALTMRAFLVVKSIELDLISEITSSSSNDIY